jgi:replicative DNA helicase
MAPDAWPLVSGDVVAADFYAPHHGALWSVLASRFDRGLPTGVVEMAGDLTAEQWKLLGGLSYVAELPEFCPATVNLRYYAGQVRSASIRRRLVSLGEWLTRAAKGEGEDAGREPDELGELAMKDLSEIAAPSVRAVTLADAWAEAEAERGKERRYSTGFPNLDALLDGGLGAGDAMVVGARPSMGKTALALSIASYVSRRVAVGIVSLEMRERRLADRILSLTSSVPHSAVRTGIRTREEQEALSGWSAALPNIHLWHEPGVPLARVSGQIRRWWAAGVRLVVVDYLTLIREPPAYRGESTSERVGRVMQGLKDLASQLGIALIVLSQLNREIDKRAPRVAKDSDGPWWERVTLPTDADLLWSTEVEGIADVILFPLRAERMNVKLRYEENIHQAAVLYVLKNRNGPTGFAPVRWLGTIASYRPLVDTSPAHRVAS